MAVFSSTVNNPAKKPPALSLRDLTILEARERGYVTFYWVTPEDEVYFGQLFKNKKDITLSEYNAALEHRPGFHWYEDAKGSDDIPKEALGETIAMELISKTPHPHLIRYLGCRVHRGRITALLVERLDQMLTQYIHEPGFVHLGKTKFVDALQSAVAYLHSLGRAHNDINPGNIMVRDGMPVFVDFGSCRPFGEGLQSTGTPGWYEEQFNTSEAKHDTYSIKKLREWLEKPE
ncbi:serine/threonine-protein kinase [Chaetomium sp. MPI-CAGE-AT-0009]|nr:serine/threonine-protein kinase [Chaetomium sp. MPI-CAGE-AT-0009]